MLKEEIKQKNLFSIVNICLLLICLASMNLFNKYFYFVFIAFFLCLLLNPKLFFNFPLVALIMLSVSILAFSTSSEISISYIFKPFVYPLCYILGMGISTEYNKQQDEKKETIVRKIILILSASMLIHYLMNWLTNLSKDQNRNTIDFWTKNVMAATSQGLLACFALAFALSVFTSKSRWFAKVLSLILIFLIFAYNLTLGGRTLFLFAIIVLLAAVFYRMHCGTKGTMGLFLGLAVLALSVFLIYRFNVLNFRTFIEESTFYERFFEGATDKIGEDNRFAKKMFYLSNFFEYPFGGLNFREQFGYAHDIFLDTYDESGIFALIAIVCYIFASIFNCLKTLRNRKISFSFRQLILCVYLISYMAFMIEPVLQGAPWLFASFCIMDGALTVINNEYKNKIDIHRKDKK